MNISPYYTEETDSEEFLFVEYFNCHSPLILESRTHEKILFCSRYEHIRNLLSKINNESINHSESIDSYSGDVNVSICESEKIAESDSNSNKITSELTNDQLESLLSFLEEDDDTIELIDKAYQADMKPILNPNDWFNNIKRE